MTDHEKLQAQRREAQRQAILTRQHQADAQRVEENVRKLSAAPPVAQPEPCRFPSCQFSGCPAAGCYEVAAPAGPSTTACAWSVDDGIWSAACDPDVAYTFTEGGPTENGHRHCHACGRPLVVAQGGSMSSDINDHSGTDSAKRLNFGAEVDTKHPAEDTAPAQLADHLASDYAWLREEYGVHIASMIGAERAVRRIPALEAERDRLKQCLNRFHHLMKKHGLHPGRTDDDLLEILDRDMEAAKVGLHHLRANNAEARAERDKLRAEVEALRAACDELIEDYTDGDMGSLKHYIRPMIAARGASSTACDDQFSPDPNA